LGPSSSYETQAARTRSIGSRSRPISGVSRQSQSRTSYRSAAQVLPPSPQPGSVHPPGSLRPGGGGIPRTPGIPTGGNQFLSQMIPSGDVDRPRSQPRESSLSPSSSFMFPARTRTPGPGRISESYRSPRGPVDPAVLPSVHSRSRGMSSPRRRSPTSSSDSLVFPSSARTVAAVRSGTLLSPQVITPSREPRSRSRSRSRSPNGRSPVFPSSSFVFPARS
jgi:hypothetical protein